MSLRSCSLRLVQRSAVQNTARLPRHSTYATQVHPHHIVTKPSAIGQPTPKSHPHLGKNAPSARHASTFSDIQRVVCTVKPGELTPGIPASEYERRRRQLVEGLPHGSLVVCVAGQVKYMSAGKSARFLLESVHEPLAYEPESYFVSGPPRLPRLSLLPVPLRSPSYKFRQASDFWYLTGFEEPDSALILGQSTSTCASPIPILILAPARHSHQQRRPALRAASACSSTARAKTRPRRNGMARSRASGTSWASSAQTRRARSRTLPTTCAPLPRAPSTCTSTRPRTTIPVAQALRGACCATSPGSSRAPPGPTQTRISTRSQHRSAGRSRRSSARCGTSRARTKLRS